MLRLFGRSTIKNKFLRALLHFFLRCYKRMTSGNVRSVNQNPECILFLIICHLTCELIHRRSHMVLQKTLPVKEEYVLLIRMTPLQRQLYEKFMNEVVRTKAVPNPLKAFAVCCKVRPLSRMPLIQVLSKLI